MQKISDWVKIIYAPTYNRLDGLLAGVSVAAIYQFLPTIWSKFSTFGNQLIIAGVLILTGAFFFCTDLKAFSTTVVGFPVLAIGYGFLVGGAISPVSFLYKWNSKITTLIATLSYGIYLSHKGIIHMIQAIFSNWGIDKNSNWMLLICMAFCVLIAWLLHLAIEKPFMKWRDRFIQQKITVKKIQLAKY
jgi:peptidoglycan/LPS O-acetylase OafA/YrhL